MDKKDNIIVSKTFEFAIKVIELYKQLLSENEFIISKQLLKSGTSIGANVEEAIAAQSRKDFVSKMSIASKEARETDYWLRLLRESNLTRISVEYLIKDIKDIINILSKIIITTKMR